MKLIVKHNLQAAGIRKLIHIFPIAVGDRRLFLFNKKTDVSKIFILFFQDKITSRATNKKYKIIVFFVLSTKYI